MLSLVFVSLVTSATPSAEKLLAKADAILAPEAFESEVTMNTIRSNGEERTFSMRIWKSGDDLHRIRFTAPADDKGTEVLRNAGDMWNYLPNLKRALRISAKQEFHGGDFSNADLLRPNLARDYTPKLVATTDEEYELQLTAKSDEVAYGVIKYWLRKKDCMPLRQEFYTSSGKLLRKLDLLEPKMFGKIMRPSRLVMWNALVPSRRSELVVKAFSVKSELDSGLFNLASLGR